MSADKQNECKKSMANIVFSLLQETYSYLYRRLLLEINYTYICILSNLYHCTHARILSNYEQLSIIYLFIIYLMAILRNIYV